MPLARPRGAWAAQRLMTTHRFRALAVGLACERLFAAISLQAGPGPSSLLLAGRCFTAEQTKKHKRRKVQTIERDTNQCARSIREARWEEVDRGAGAGSSGSAAREGRRAMRESRRRMYGLLEEGASKRTVRRRGIGFTPSPRGPLDPHSRGEGGEERVVLDRSTLSRTGRSASRGRWGCRPSSSSS
jgi:hypothetical protein